MLRAYAALAVLVLALPLGAAVPGQVDFQGLLLDAAGEKVNGAVDLTFRLYDAPAAGTLLWTESHNDVQVADGVYGVTLGAVTPLTQNELGGGTVYLEIQVESETLTPRRQLLAVPYAIRAESADSLDGVSGEFFSQLITYGNADGTNPGNSDPREGLGDADGDGVANFMESNNDGDGMTDDQEIQAGTDMNQKNPNITSVSPALSQAGVPVTITVGGTGFGAGLNVTIGSENVIPTNITSTSIVIQLPAQPVGRTTITVSYPSPNGASDQHSVGFYGRRVFLSNPMTNGGFEAGALGADNACGLRAGQLGMVGTFYPWIATSTSSPAQRFNQGGVGFSRPDGTKIADDWTDLTDGTLDAAIVEGGTGFVWTGTGADGNAAGGNCSDWTSSSAGTLGLRGISGQTDLQWTVNSGGPCNTSNLPVYCFEQ